MARGRKAEVPSEIPAKGWKDIAIRIKNEISDDRVSLIAAGVAFYGLLALFPAIAALIAVSGLVMNPSQIVDQLGSLNGLVPDDVLTIITDQASAVAGSREGGLGLTAIIGFLFALYSASKGMGSLMDGINVAYDEEEERGFLKLQAVTFGLTLFLIFGLVVSAAAIVALPAVLGAVNWGSTVEFFLKAGMWILLAALTILGLAVVYRFGPSRDKPEWRWISPGAIIACIAWVIGSAAFGYYVANFGTYNESFGTLGGVIVLLMWLWISAFIIMLGAELNSEMEAQTRHDTTVGPDQPMGERDAQKADNLGVSSA